MIAKTINFICIANPIKSNGLLNWISNERQVGISHDISKLVLYYLVIPIKSAYKMGFLDICTQL
jgi:hypothetical protein